MSDGHPKSWIRVITNRGKINEHAYLNNFKRVAVSHLHFCLVPPQMPSSSSSASPAVFSSIRYAIASSLPAHRADQFRHVLDTNGASYLPKGIPDPSLNTLITNSNRFEGWEDVATRAGVRVVTDKWVERSVLLGKTQP